MQMLKDQVRVFELDASDVGKKLFEAWRNSHVAIFDVSGQIDQIEAFDGSHRLWSTDRFVLSKNTCSGISFLRSPEPGKNAFLDHFGIRLVVAGTVEGAAAARKLIAGAGDVVVLDLQQSMLLETSSEGETTSDLTLWIPRSRLQSLVADEILLHGLILKGKTPGGATLGSALRTFAMHADQMTQDEMNAIADGLTELAAKLFASSLTAMKQAQSTPPTASFVTIRRFIDRNLSSSELGVDMIARSFGLSRASLYRLFEPIGGIATYIRKQRLDRAFREITAAGFANRRIGPIAYRCGFKNVAAFNRAFRETYGMKPTQARSANSAVRSCAAFSPANAGDAGLLAQWLLETTYR
jgi:AraC-like DNA-binding protein